MGMFLNSSASFKAYQAAAEDFYYVDKTMLLAELFPMLGKKNRYVCITRPRRFGKTVMANMVDAFFGRAQAARLFDRMEISRHPDYGRYRNRYDVIYIDFSRAPELCSSYQKYITRITDGLKRDLRQAFPDLEADPDMSVWDLLQEINERWDANFLFVMDEWDAVFHMPFVTQKEQRAYLLFLKYLLKDQPYVELAYMTGVLPIAKYSSGSELNMFAEYSMFEAEKFSSYFGFHDGEVDRLFQEYLERTALPRFDREDLRIWYDGYWTASGQRLYNPRSVVLALTDNQLRNYWTSSGPYDELFYYIRNNVDAVRDDLALMAAGERVPVKIGQYAAVSMEVQSREQIHSALVVYGLLTYTDGEVFIPNRELMDQYNELLLSKESLGYVHRLAKKSERMLQATQAGDTEQMEEILQFAHNTETPILSYNSEAELAALVNLCYLSARNRYRVEREEKAGKGFVDFIFYPEHRGEDCLILELKVDSSPEAAIAQIRKKQYALRFLREETFGKYTGRILAVGISYSRKTKKHSCKIEILREKCEEM